MSTTVPARRRPTSYGAMPDASRILVECELKPVQGHRFQPTGFPHLGAAEYVAETEDGQVDCLLVDSNQSVANWLESVCMDGSRLEEPLNGLPVVTLVDDSGDFVANTMTEPHRIGSAYLLRGKDTTLVDLLEHELGVSGKTAKGDTRDFARFVFKHDTPTLLHGVFVPSVAGGKYRLTRILSGFTEATGARPADSGGVKHDHIDATGKVDGKGGAAEGYGSIPYPRRDYTAERIILYFSIDLALLRSYKLGEVAEQLLLALAVWKIRRLTRQEIKFRSGCDLRVVRDLTVTAPNGYELPGLRDAEAVLKESIKRCRDESLFTTKPVIVKHDQK